MSSYRCGPFSKFINLFNNPIEIITESGCTVQNCKRRVVWLFLCKSSLVPKASLNIRKEIYIYIYIYIHIYISFALMGKTIVLLTSLHNHVKILVNITSVNFMFNFMLKN
ncbi:hypothetical protein JHK84_048403 [Glycine max]|nr:hypothetical protein JHK86_048369 [Glycine max]KAG5103434.1 hypothetical protein JHK84_048403 [Glycine max]